MKNDKYFFNSKEKSIIIEVTIKGIEVIREGKFILDTGANGLVLNSKYYTFQSSTNNQALGLNGGFNNVETSIIDTMFIDEISFNRVKTDVINLGNIEERKNIRIEGLVGYEILKNFEIQLNYQETFITLSRLNKDGSMIDPMMHTLDKIDSFEFQMANFLPVIDVTIKGNIKKMGIDTGAEVNLLNTKKNDDIIDNFIPIRKMDLTGSENLDVEYLGGKLYRVAIGRYKCGGMSTALVNLSSLNNLYKTRLDGILGYNFLAPWVFSINYKKKMLYIHTLKFVKP